MKEPMFTVQSFESLKPGTAPSQDGAVCGPEGCVVPERAVDAALSAEAMKPIAVPGSAERVGSENTELETAGREDAEQESKMG